MMDRYPDHMDLKSLDDEDDLSDDEVFSRGGKSIPLEENGVNKPLMARRMRNRDGLQTKVRKVPALKIIWVPVFYFFVTLFSIISIIFLLVFLINVFMKNSPHNSLKKSSMEVNFAPCTKITTKDVWIKTFPMLTTETAVRLNDVNSDGIDDIILGFGTGADAFHYPKVVCRVYFPKSKDECGGGMMALNGKTGQELWRHYSAHEIFAINCNADLNEDGVKDCLGGGRMAGFSAINGKDGTLLWEFDDQVAKIDTSNVYTPQYLEDIDFDSVPDLLVVHGGDPLKQPGSKTRLVGRLMIVSGKTGRVLRWMQVPDGHESYYSPQILTHPDGSSIVLFGTGGETHGGSLWYVKLKHLLNGEINKAKKIYSDKFKGVMTPPVLVDITGDGVLDIVMAMFNSSVIAFNGLNFACLWEYNQPSSESYSTPGVGYFNNDSVPDFIVNYQTGPGFPIYYYTQTTILDGRNGKPLLRKPIEMVVGTQTSPLVVSVQGKGNDIFLYWVSDCHGSNSKIAQEFEFAKGTSVHDQSRADFCKLRFKEKLYTRMYALTSHSSVPGTVVYDSDLRKAIEFSNPINYSALGLEFLYRHPGYQEDYQSYLESENNGDMEDRFLLGDLPSGYDVNDAQLERMAGGRKYSDLTDYGAPDYLAEGKVYPSYYQHQSNVGSERFFPSSDYNPPPARYALLKKARLKKVNPWGGAFSQFQKLRRKFNTPDETVSQGKRRVRSRGKRLKGSKRSKRHVGPHDGGGIQRVISTGTLAPSLSKNKGGVDVIYATFWFYPSDLQQLLPEDKACIAQRMALEKERFDPSSSFFGLDHDAFEELVNEECLRQSGHFKTNKKKSYNPFNRPMGQMTVYRTHLNCMCQHFSKGYECAKVLPFEEQMWTSYMGLNGNCIANSRH